MYAKGLPCETLGYKSQFWFFTPKFMSYQA